MFHQRCALANAGRRHLGWRGFPDGIIRLHGPASYAQLSIAPNVVDGLPAVASIDPAKRDLRYVRHWLASTPFVMPRRMDATLQENTGIDPVYSPMPKTTVSWKPIAPDPGGLVNLTRWCGEAQTGQTIAGMWLKTTLNADPNWDYAAVKLIGYNGSKAALNMFTVLLAAELKDTGIKVNAVNPGYTTTALNGNSGHQSIEEGAAETVHMARISDDGPTGGFTSTESVEPW